MRCLLNNKWGHTLDGYGYQFDPLGLRTNIVRNLGLTSSSVTAGFDNIGQVTSWSAAEAGGTPRQNEQLGFGYDAAHNLHTRNNGNLAQTFTTDAANQLNSVTRTGTFTMSGAMPAPATSVTVNGQAAQTYGDFTFARTNLSLVNGQNGFTNIAQNAYGLKATNILTVNLPQSVTLNYDLNGNLTNDGLRSFAYDSENQLTNITLAGSWKSDFIYDGFNRRRIARDFVWQSGAWVLTNETHYIYDGRLLIQERGTNNNSLVTYTRGLDLGGSLRRAGGIGGLLARTDTNGSTFYHADALGNITALMDGNENITARYLYNPFGKLIGKWGGMADANVMQFSSMPHDNLSGLSLYPFRAYDPNLQRFLNQDPIGERGGINLYRFVNNNPLRYIDPLGLEGNPVMGLGGAWNNNPYGPGGSFYGPGYQYTPYQGPTDPIDVANSYVGSYQYNSFVGNPFDSHVREVWAGFGDRPNKCNKFVGDCISSCPNRPKPLVNGRFPTADQWRDPNINIPGYGPPHSPPLPGDVVSEAGHVGFMDYNGNYIEASSYGPVKSLDPNNNNTGWNPGTGRSPTP